MKYAHRTDFLFIGVAVLPALLMVAGYLDVAFIFFCPLLIVACLHGMYEQKVEPAEQKPKPLRDAGSLDRLSALKQRAKLADIRDALEGK